MEQIAKQFIAVRAMITNEDDQILVIRESDEYQGGAGHSKYDFPGGKVKLGESLADALSREVEEETGLIITANELVWVDEWRPVVKGEQIQIFGVFFLCKPKSSLVIKLSADHDDYRWISPDNPDSLSLIRETENALRALVKKTKS